MWQFYSFLALVFCKWQCYILAEFLAYYAVLTAKESFGVNDARTKKSIDDLLDIYKAQNKKYDAIELINDSICVWEVSKGKDHPHILALYENLKTLEENKTVTKQKDEIITSEKIEEIEEECDLTDNHYFGIPIESICEPEPIIEEIRKEKIKEEKEEKIEEIVSEESTKKKGGSRAMARSLIDLAMFYGVQNKYDEAVNLINYALSVWDGEEEININELKFNTESIVNGKLLGIEDAVIKLIEEPMSPVPSFTSVQVVESEKFKWPRKTKKSLTI